MNSLFKIGDDSINLMPTPIQTIIQDLQENDKLVNETIVLFTPENSPLHTDDYTMTMSQETEPSNALELIQQDTLDIDMMQYPNPDDILIDDILNGDEALELDFAAANDNEEPEQVRAITHHPAPVSPPDSEIQLVSENSAKIDRHVSQIAERKTETDWEALPMTDDQQQFMPQNMRQMQVQMHLAPQPTITSCKIKFFTDAVYELNTAKPDSARFLFVNTMEAKRENQRTTRFGVVMESNAMDLVRLDEHRLVVWLSLPGVYTRLTTCNSHARKVAEKFQHNDFMKVNFMNKQVTEQIQPNTIAALDSHPSLWVMPLPKNGDRDAIELSFFCFSSCLKKGNAKEKLQLNVAILDSDNNVLQRDHQFIRVTANPQRDAGIWGDFTPGVAKGGNSKQPRKQGTKRMPMKQSRADSDDDYLPGTLKRIKREPAASPPAYIELHELPALSQHSLATNDSFNRLVDLAPVAERDGVRAQLLRMHSEERNNFIAQENERIWSNLQTSLKYHREPRP